MVTSVVGKVRKPLYVFLHVHKTGGSTITLHIRKNCQPKERQRITRFIDSKEVDKETIKEFFEVKTVKELDDLKGDSTKLRNKLGWKPKYTFESMIDEMVEHWLEYYE